MGRTTSLAIAVLVVIGGTGVVLSSKTVPTPVHSLRGSNINALSISDPNAQFDPPVPSVLGRYDIFGGFVATQQGAGSRSD
jgi:hypothetical protein